MPRKTPCGKQDEVRYIIYLSLVWLQVGFKMTLQISLILEGYFYMAYFGGIQVMLHGKSTLIGNIQILVLDLLHCSVLVLPKNLILGFFKLPNNFICVYLGGAAAARPCSAPCLFLSSSTTGSRKLYPSELLSLSLLMTLKR